MTELKPCPFCGGKAYMWRTNYQVFIQCVNSDCGKHNRHLIEVSADTEKDAIKHWNRRVNNG